ncbi:hypothetical protein L7F22_069196 [Adiantum nelumboides]|nr:hypothetical protein [Adiantum nelumboides]
MGFAYGDEDDEEDYEEAPPSTGRRRRDTEIRRDCPYLDTVNRQYFQGRGRNSHAYTHSLEASHHVFINLLTEKVYCLPDGYEVNDPSLDDIRHMLYPRFTRAQVNQLDRNKQWARALDGSDYLPGMVDLILSRKVARDELYCMKKKPPCEVEELPSVGGLRASGQPARNPRSEKRGSWSRGPSSGSAIDLIRGWPMMVSRERIGQQ